MYEIMKNKRTVDAGHGYLLCLLLFVFLFAGCSTTPVEEQSFNEAANGGQLPASGTVRSDHADSASAKPAEQSAAVDAAMPEQNGAAEGEDSSAEVPNEADDVDPLEGFNRSMYSFNEAVDDYIAEPVTKAYKWISPEFVQTGIANFYDNFKDIGVVLNDFLQGKFLQGSQDTGRFLLNTTVGLAGLFDVATYAGLEQHDEDFGQTLAVWGVPTGPYLVIPFLGPTTFRGVPGAVVDAAANPVAYLPWGFAAVAALNKRANAQGSLQFIDEAALDPYIFTRESYLQWREFLATDGNPAISDDSLDEDLFDDEPDDEDDDGQTSGAADASGMAAVTPAVNGSTQHELPAVPEKHVQATNSSENAEVTASAETEPYKKQGGADSLQMPSDTSGVQSENMEDETPARQDATVEQSFQQASQAFEEASRVYSEADQELSEVQNK